MLAGPMQQKPVLSFESFKATRHSQSRAYRAIYDWNSPLFRYAMRATPPIRIIVQNRRVTLKGVVATQLERRYAYTAARNTPGTLEVKDELQVENTND